MNSKEIYDIFERALDKCVDCINDEDFSENFLSAEDFLCVFANINKDTAKTIMFNLSDVQKNEIKIRMDDYERQKRINNEQ